MPDVFLLCLALGAGVLVVQIVLSLFGGDAVPHSVEDAGAGADLLSVRAISAGTALFGAVGLWLGGRGVPLVITLPAAVAAGIAAAAGTAYITRQMLRFESDGSLRLGNAVGESGTVYLPVPARRGGFGMVQLRLQGRTVELRAVADEATEIPTGSSVIIVAIEGDTVEVTPTPLIEGIDA
jgi:membrane protein implicated in regulation of membrane protease activity